MYQIDFKKPCHIYFMGIGGISMSAFAELLHSFGFTISGSDAKSSPITTHLESMGMKINYGHKAENITDDIDCAVYTAAVHEDNPELMEVRRKNIPALTRGQLVGECTNNYANTITFSGTHGKTTATSMMSYVLLNADLDPTINVGGMLDAIHGNIRIGKSENFLLEACEYTNSFLNFNPKLAAILNIEADHLDFFKDLDDIRNSFHLYAKRIPKDGTLVINGDIPDVHELTDDLVCTVKNFGIAEDASEANKYNITAVNLTFDDTGCGTFDLYYEGKQMGEIKLSVIGKHNVNNALPVIGLSLIMNIPFDKIQTSLEDFHGVGRRFDYKGTIGGVTIYDDYAHHPTAIKTTLQSAKKLPHKNLWCVFQPHTYTRTKALMEEFIESLTYADKVVLVDIYPARETDTLGVSSLNIKEGLEKLGKEVYYFPDFDEAETFLLQNCMNGDLLITMGAGDVVKIGESILGL